MALVDTVVVFVVNLLIGALGIYLGARVVTDVSDFGYAFVTALIGAAVWAVVGFFFGWIPFLGALLSLLVYLAVINYRYPGGWVNAIKIALVAWIASIVVLFVLAILEVVTFEALGVPVPGA